MKHNYVPDGCFLLARMIFESAIWKDDPHVLKLFIYLIGNARYNSKSKKYSHFEIKRGELVTSLTKISEENEYYQNGTIKSWGRMKISRMLDILEKQGYIKRLCDTYGTHISICNYDTYQDLNSYKCDTDDTQLIHSCDTSDTPPLLNKKDKKDNKEKKDIVKKKLKTAAPNNFEPSDNLTKWAEELGFNKGKLIELSEACFDHHDGKGNKMVDWEAAIRTWCRNDIKFNGKPEDKKQGSWLGRVE